MDRNDSNLQDRYGSRLEGEENSDERDNSRDGGSYTRDLGDFPDMGVDGSVKKEWTALNFYLPATHIERINDTYREMRYLSDDRLQKGRHFYPLIVELGLERIEGMEINDVKDRLESIEE